MGLDGGGEEGWWWVAKERRPAQIVRQPAASQGWLQIGGSLHDPCVYCMAASSCIMANWVLNKRMCDCVCVWAC